MMADDGLETTVDAGEPSGRSRRGKRVVLWVVLAVLLGLFAADRWLFWVPLAQVKPALAQALEDPVASAGAGVVIMKRGAFMYGCWTNMDDYVAPIAAGRVMVISDEEMVNMLERYARMRVRIWPLTPLEKELMSLWVWSDGRSGCTISVRGKGQGLIEMELDHYLLLEDGMHPYR